MISDILHTVHEASEQDADRAVAAAKAAQPAWAALSIEERSKPFKKLAALVREHNAELAELEALSMGVPVSTYFHAHAFASTFDYYSEAGYNNQGNSSLNTPGFVNLTFRQPFGGGFPQIYLLVLVYIRSVLMCFQSLQIFFEDI